MSSCGRLNHPFLPSPTLAHTPKHARGTRAHTHTLMFSLLALSFQHRGPRNKRSCELSSELTVVNVHRPTRTPRLGLRAGCTLWPPVVALLGILQLEALRLDWRVHAAWRPHPLPSRLAMLACPAPGHLQIVNTNGLLLTRIEHNCPAGLAGCADVLIYNHGFPDSSVVPTAAQDFAATSGSGKARAHGHATAHTTLSGPPAPDRTHAQRAEILATPAQARQSTSTFQAVSLARCASM